MSKKQIELLDSEYAEKFRALQLNDDQEAVHVQADDILCDLLRKLGFNFALDEYDKIDKWYA